MSYARFRLIAIGLCLLACAKVNVCSADTASWQDADIGGPDVAGGHQTTADTLTVIGAGMGDASDKDQLHFTYRTLPAGDIVVVARLTTITGTPLKARAGIMLRDGLSPNASAAMISVVAPIAEATNFYCRSRDVASIYRGRSNGSDTILKLPVWIKLVRVGNDFAVYRSQDGKIWSQVHNVSGGAFRATGPVQLGFFASSAVAKSTASATFDHILIRKPNLAYRSSWIGNTYSQASTGLVCGATSTLWVGLDGTCLTNTIYDEAGEASKIYKDGKVVKSFREENDPLGNSYSAEGSITSDGKRVFLASRHVLYKSDMLGRAIATEPVYFAHNMWDDQKNLNVTSGMALVNNELYVGDSRDDKILVARPEHNTWYSAGNTTVNQTDHAIDTSGVPNAAPEAVYQSQRENDGLPYVIPGMDPKETYTVRCHFAEYTETKPGRRLIDISAGGQTVTGFDVVQAAGGVPYRAVVKDISGVKAGTDGKLNISFFRTPGGDGHQVICGFEVLKADGTVAFAVNCGGPAIGNFQSEVNEISDRAFDFQRPGPMTADKRGNLWIIQEAGDFPVGALPVSKYPAAIKCYRTDGTFTGWQITDVVNPTAVAYDAKTDRLLVAENGPDQNIRAYSGLSTSPHLDTTFGKAGTFGIKGGIYTGKTPGLLYDPAAGGWLRFYGLNGVGVDGGGNIYVACSSSGTDLRKYTPNGKLVWMQNALHFVDCADFDQNDDGADIYTPFKHYTMDYSQTAPGSEWKYVSFNWNPFKYGPPPRISCSSAVFRRLGPKSDRIMFTSGQGQVDYIGVFRFDGEIAVPCGRIQPKGANFEMWIDANGDGAETPNELTLCPNPGYFQSFAVDKKGDLWLACMGATNPVLRHFRFKGLNSHGVPLYGNATADYEDIAYPGIGKPVNTWGQSARVNYDSERDIMYLFGPANDRKAPEANPTKYIARYDNWSKGNRKARWLTVLPDPGTDPNFVYPMPTRPGGLAFEWEAFDVAVDKIFVAEMYGPIHVYDAKTGALDTVLAPGPEVSGFGAWEDEQMGVRAHKRANGEYIVFAENSGFGAKNAMFRWKPPASK